MAAVAIFDFQNFKFVTVGYVRRVEIAVTAAEIWCFVGFFKMAAAAILDF